MATSIETCPICKNALRKDLGYFMPDHFLSKHEGLDRYYSGLNREDGWLRQYPRTIDGKFEYMESQRKPKILSTLKQKTEAFIKYQDIPQTVEQSPAESIRSSTEELKKYILTLIHLENNIYSLSQRLQELYYHRLLNNKTIVYETFKPSPSLKEAQIRVDRLRDKYRKASLSVIDAEEKTYSPNVSMKYPQEPTAPVLTKPGLFNKKSVEAENAERLAKYQAELDAYQIELQRYREKKEAMIADMREKDIREATKRKEAAELALSQAEKELENAKNAPRESILPSNAIKEFLDKEIAGTEGLIKNTIIARNKLYAFDIVFGKYRNAVALSSFYEYLLSGRCATLDGVNGAYNIYENEIRMNSVIAQLDVVISALEDIKQTQYMMYKELQDINTSLDSLNSKMSCALKSIKGIEANTTEMSAHLNHISQNSDVIAYNTAVTAYYSKVNAELTNALGYMVAFN
jgi:hypothetical protein